MAISSIGPAVGTGVAPLADAVVSKTNVTGGSGESFAQLVRGMVDKANQPYQQVDTALTQLISGESDSVHNVVMSAVEADMSFRFVLELRNRLTESYQEIMRMQV